MAPETALKQAEQFCADGNVKSALEVLQSALQNRRNKGNNSMLERLMVSPPPTLLTISCSGELD
jgi:thioredoxin-like negative regulator of GroEL